MTEPILTRDEVEALAHRIGMTYVHSDYVDMRRYTFGILTLEQLAAAIEAAVLEKVCGEPVGFVTNVGGYWHMEPIVNWEQIGLSTRLYALTRSKP
ncbi:hypothetical protein [Burkholderia ambifaria]|uniref:hypothetical protein n=1 Tax=Burkholderia ambifaria TaxID=152480 RepID=UPI00158AD9F0|nr:hypothetical protein [Burkholderia ambifaria]